MGVWHEFCLVCGGPPYGLNLRTLVWWAGGMRSLDSAQLAELRQLSKDMRWAKHWIGISSTEEQVKLGWYDEYGAFEARDDGGKFHLRTNFVFNNVPDGERYGIAAHCACATLLEQELGYTLRFADLFRHLGGEFGNLLAGLSYGNVAIYWSQNYETYDAWQDGMAWVLRNPLEDPRSRRRILRMWRPVVRAIRAKAKKKKRPSRAKGTVVPKAKARRPAKQGKAR